MARYETTSTEQGVSVLRRKHRPIGDAWTCTCCGRLLGIVHGNQVHIRFDRRHEYVAGLPAAANCKGCGTLNRVAFPL